MFVELDDFGMDPNPTLSGSNLQPQNASPPYDSTSSPL